MRKRNASFHYFTDSFVENYRKKIVNYLIENEYKFKEIGEPQVVVEFHNFDRTEHPKPNGHLYIQDIEDNSNKFEDVCKHILSKDRKFIPLWVTCSNKEDYTLLEDILKDNYGERGRLTRGLFGIGLLFNERIIKRE